MKKTLLTLVALLLLYCAGSPTDPNRSSQGETPDTGKGPSVVTRSQDPLLLDFWDMQYARDDDYYYMIFDPDSIVIRIAVSGSKPTVSHSWYTRAGVLYIENMAGIFTGNAEFTYRIRDTSYAYPGGDRRERWLWLSIINGREDMVPVAARPYTIDCMSRSGRCPNWKP